MKCHDLFAPNMQDIKWRLHWRSHELVATDAEGTLHFSFTHREGSVQTHEISQRRPVYFSNLYRIVGIGTTVFEINYFLNDSNYL
jgi:hypothetical protein